MSKWAEGSIQHNTAGSLDGTGIVKTAGNEGYKASSELSSWEKGSNLSRLLFFHLFDNTTEILSSFLLLSKTKPVSLSNLVFFWGTHIEDNIALDQIVRTQPNKDWVASSEVPAMSKGTIAYEDKNLDGYGVIRRAEN